MVIQEPDLGPQRGGVTGREGTWTKNLLLLSDTNSILLQVLEAFHERRRKKSELKQSHVSQ